LKLKQLGIAVAALLLGIYLFFCPCINEGLYELLAIHPTHDFVDVLTPYEMAGCMGEHRVIPFMDAAGHESKMYGIYFKAKATSKAKSNSNRPIALFSLGNSFCVRHNLGTKQQIALLDLGYDLFIYDYQGFGLSEGQASYKRLGDSGLLAYDFVKTILKKDKIFLYGVSMGTGVSSYIAERRPVLGVILDSPYTTPEYTLKTWIPVLFIYPSCFFPAPHYDNEMFVKGKHPPTLIVTKGDDHVTIPEQGLRLAKVASPPTYSLFMPHSAHGYVAIDEEESYTSTLRMFLSKYAP
jgi:hypothetical protein